MPLVEDGARLLHEVGSLDAEVVDVPSRPGMSRSMNTGDAWQQRLPSRRTPGPNRHSRRPDLAGFLLAFGLPPTLGQSRTSAETFHMTAMQPLCLPGGAAARPVRAGSR